MKIAVITDMEGVAGIQSFEDWTEPGGRYYERGREFLTEEVNAAIEGFYTAFGAAMPSAALEITVIDGHGQGGIDPWLLDKRALLSRGWGVPHQFGLNDNFDAAAWIGQHAKSGTLAAHMAHTGSCDVLDFKINGVSMGEFGQCAAIAGFYGAAVLFGSGDRAFCDEAKALTQRIHTVEVKHGVNLKDGSECDAAAYRNHTLGAVHLHPLKARELIRQGAEKALLDFLANRSQYEPLLVPRMKLRWRYISEVWYRDKHKETRRHKTDIVEMYSATAEREAF